jgi:hypothetical protein
MFIQLFLIFFRLAPSLSILLIANIMGTLAAWECEMAVWVHVIICRYYNHCDICNFCTTHAYVKAVTWDEEGIKPCRFWLLPRKHHKAWYHPLRQRSHYIGDGWHRANHFTMTYVPMDGNNRSPGFQIWLSISSSLPTCGIFYTHNKFYCTNTCNQSITSA